MHEMILREGRLAGLQKLIVSEFFCPNLGPLRSRFEEINRRAIFSYRRVHHGGPLRKEMAAVPQVPTPGKCLMESIVPL
jgi:hypothetical protein